MVCLTPLSMIFYDISAI